MQRAESDNEMQDLEIDTSESSGNIAGVYECIKQPAATS